MRQCVQVERHTGQTNEQRKTGTRQKAAMKTHPSVICRMNNRKCGKLRSPICDTRDAGVGR